MNAIEAIGNIIIMSVIAMVLTMSGCDTKSLTEGNVTPDLQKAGNRAKSEIVVLRAEMEDDIFWESTDRAQKLIEDTIEKGPTMTVSFKLTCSDGSEIVLDDFASFRLVYINDVWRSLISNEVIYKLATSDEVAKAHDEGKTVEITGVILRWRERKGLFDGNKERIISVCDLNNDSSWDYVIHGKLFFTNVETVALEDANGEILGIGVINTTPATLQPVGKQAGSLRELFRLAHKGDDA